MKILDCQWGEWGRVKAVTRSVGAEEGQAGSEGRDVRDSALAAGSAGGGWPESPGGWAAPPRPGKGRKQAPKEPPGGS